MNTKQKTAQNLLANKLIGRFQKQKVNNRKIRGAMFHEFFPFIISLSKTYYNKHSQQMTRTHTLDDLIAIGEVCLIDCISRTYNVDRGKFKNYLSASLFHKFHKLLMQDAVYNSKCPSFSDLQENAGGASDSHNPENSDNSQAPEDTFGAPDMAYNHVEVNIDVKRILAKYPSRIRKLAIIYLENSGNISLRDLAKAVSTASKSYSHVWVGQKLKEVLNDLKQLYIKT